MLGHCPPSVWNLGVPWPHGEFKVEGAYIYDPLHMGQQLDKISRAPSEIMNVRCSKISGNWGIYALKQDENENIGFVACSISAIPEILGTLTSMLDA